MTEADKPGIHPELVQVFDTNVETEAMVIQGLLDSAGIESLLSGHDTPQDVLPGVGGVLVRVAAEDADEARKVVEQYQGSLDSVVEIEEGDAVSTDGEESP